MERIKRFEEKTRRTVEDKMALGRWLLCRLLRKDFTECEIANAFMEETKT